MFYFNTITGLDVSLLILPMLFYISAEVPDEEYYTKSVENSKAHARKLEEKYIEILTEHEV